jgi:cytochrome c oxidase subunit II
MGWMTQASTSAHRADIIFLAVLAIAVFMLIAITGTMIFFVLRYRKERHPEAVQIEGNTLLEVVWTVVPLVVFLAIFYYGWTNYEYMRNPPRDAMVVKVTGRQWNWSFEYPNGKRTGALYAVLNRPMKVEVRSADVVHGFFIPAFRTKIDAVPGRVNTTWFQPTQLGAFDIECTVICGVSHSAMLAKVVVVPEEAFKHWYFGDENAPEPAWQVPVKAVIDVENPAFVLLRNQHCLECHSIDGRTMVGPTFKGMFGRREEIEAGGQRRTVSVDDAQIRRGIQDPMSEIVRGFPSAMPPESLDPKELDEAVAYIKLLK